MRRNLLFILVSLAWLPAEVSGQIAHRDQRDEALTAPDSGRALRTARSAQRRFELLRRSHLPWTHDPGSGPCDERIGRFCIWHSSGGSSWKPPPDPDPVLTGRRSLIEELNSAARQLPGDAWVVGQRVRYLTEAGEHDAASAAARSCRSSEAGWCSALLGYALHGAGEFLAAESAFGVALGEMAPSERNRWTDISVLLADGEVRGYRRLSAEERAAFEDRFWWLANPLYLVDGNDRRTEHFVRHVTDRLQDRARSTEGISWGWDLRELLLRYGSPAGWERIRSRLPGMQDVRILTRYPQGGRRFEPSGSFIEDPYTVDESEWELNPRRSRTAYAPLYVDSVFALEHQLAVFRRGDSLRVVAALRPPPDTTGVPAQAQAALVHMQDESASPSIRTGAAREAIVLDLTIGDHPGVVSIETLAAEERVAARARYGLSLPPRDPFLPALSDLLVLRGNTEPPGESLEDVLPYARPNLRVRAGEPIALYWEIYGVSPSTETLDLSLHLIDHNAGVLRRIANRAGLMRQQSPLAVHWREHTEASPVISRSLALEIPEVSAGSYSLRLTISMPGREPLHADRVIQVEDSPDSGF